MQQVVSIQILRALAALAVAYGHAGADAATIAAQFGRSFQAPWQGQSAAGVDLFFVISGFVMVCASRDLFGRPDAPKRFFLRRLCRILPLYWLMTTIVIGIAFVTPGALNSAVPTLTEILKSFFFVPYLRADGQFQPLYGLGWTLNYEMFFYACFAAAVWLPIRQALLAVATLLLAIAGAGASLDLVWQPAIFWSNPIILEFLLGMGIGYLYLKHPALPLWLCLGLAGAGAALFFALNANGFPSATTSRLVTAGIPAALIVAACTLGEGTIRGRWRWLVLLGDASYALYLVHPFAVRALRLLWNATGAGAIIWDWAYMAAALVVSCLVAVALHVLAEKPVTRWLQHRTAG